MINIIRASIFKLFKDWTFRITMFIGLGLAALLIGIQAGIGQLNGQSMLPSAESAKDLSELRTPMISAARQIKGAYGSMMRSSGITGIQRLSGVRHLVMG